MKTVVEYDIFLPVFSSASSRISASRIKAVEKELLCHFGGLTFFLQKNIGLWKFGSYLYKDEIVLCRVLASNSHAARTFFKRAKKRFEKQFRQHSILIIERKVTVI